jgi:hypothetical protein
MRKYPRVVDEENQNLLFAVPASNDISLEQPRRIKILMASEEMIRT